MPENDASENQTKLASDASMTPQQIVAELDRYIVGQDDAKRAIAIAVRNRWRRNQLSEELQRDVAPKNILMAGPTGVGKTEIARRLARLTGAPFTKVEATKYTEVGYYGRDVESMVRDLVENAITMLRQQKQDEVRETAAAKAEERLLDLLVPSAKRPESMERDVTKQIDLERNDLDWNNLEQADTEQIDTEHAERKRRTREKMRDMLRKGTLDNKTVEFSIEQRTTPVMMGGVGLENMDVDLQGMLEKIIPKSTKQQSMTVARARKVLLEQEADKLIDDDKIASQAIHVAENSGIIFVDEIDKVIATEGKSADVSRQGVQRDLLPIVEGTSVQTKHGYIKTDHILFIAAGAFHRGKPSELMPELQGRFPIRVELSNLSKDHFVRILTEPKNALTKQYQALMQTEGVELIFTDDAIDRIADYGFRTNQSNQNIGARRLYTILEKLLEELNFDAADKAGERITIDANYVDQRLKSICEDEDLSQFIL